MKTINIYRNPQPYEKITRLLLRAAGPFQVFFQCGSRLRPKDHRESTIFDVKLRTFFGDTITGIYEGGFPMWIAVKVGELLELTIGIRQGAYPSRISAGRQAPATCNRQAPIILDGG